MTCFTAHIDADFEVGLEMSEAEVARDRQAS